MAATRSLPGRSTRGRRMGTLVGEEADADEEFWGQGAFQEDEEDEDFDSGGEKAAEQPDEVDSDFDADEAVDAAAEAQDQDAAVRREERATAVRSSKRRKRYVDPALAKAKRPPPAASPNTRRRRSAADQGDLNVDKGSLRRSTKMASASSAKVRVQRAAAEEERKKAREIAIAKRVVERPLTQEELLEETRITEKQNIRDLEQLLKLEEEKKRAPPKKITLAGPTMRFRSFKGEQTISFSSKKDIPALFRPSKVRVTATKASTHKFRAALKPSPSQRKKSGDLKQQAYENVCEEPKVAEKTQVSAPETKKPDDIAAKKSPTTKTEISRNPVLESPTKPCKSSPSKLPANDNENRESTGETKALPQEAKTAEPAVQKTATVKDESPHD